MVKFELRGDLKPVNKRWDDTGHFHGEMRALCRLGRCSEVLTSWNH